MSKKASPTLIGVFVVGAAALAASALLVFGGGRFFAEEIEYVTYFDRSVRGLDVGAPVRLQGVPIGTVSRIVAVYSQKADELRIPVYVALERGTVENEDEVSKLNNPRKAIAHLIEKKGLRAQLSMDSLVTGKLFIALDFLPDTPIEYRGPGNSGKIRELPTVPTELEEFLEKIKNLPVTELVESATAAITEMRQLLSSDELKGVLTSLDSALQNFDKLVRNVDTQVQPISEVIAKTLEEAKTALANITQLADEGKELVRDADGQIEPVSQAAQEFLANARKTLSTLSGAIDGGSQLRLQVAEVLDELSGASRSIRLLADFLERHPEALLLGKEKP